MSFGSSVRFEVKDGGKGGIFWQKEKPKQKPRKYGYKTKELRHTIRKPEPEYIEEPVQNPKKPSRDFIKKNREQYRMQKRDDDKENHRSNSASTGRPSSEIKAGTVTLTQDQLNALLATVGKLKPGEGGSLRISIDAENNRLQVETPHDNSDSVPNSNHSDTGDQRSVQGESSIFDLTKNSKSAAPPENRDSSGYGSEEKSHGGKEVRFDSARNEEWHKTPEAPSVPPPMVPWRHMTLGERKRLQWAREKAAAEEEEKKQKAYDPWGRPGAGAPQKKPESDSQEDSQFRTKEEEKLRKAIDEIESKYGSLLKQAEKEASQSAGGQHENRADRDSDKTDSAAIPGLDVSYDADSGRRDNKSSKNRKQLEDKGNSRPPRKQDKGEERRSRGEDRKNKGDRNTNRTGQRQEEEKERQARVERKKKEREEDERVMEALEAREEARRKAASMENSAVAPAAMQTSLFIGQAEPDNTRFLSKKEEEKRRWLEELDRQREEKRLQKQREKERQREGIDDTWADRFVTDGAKRLPQSHPQQQQPPPPPYASGGVMERSLGQPQSSVVEQTALPPAAMRSAIAIGDTAPNLDKIEQKQAEEKRLWLDELNKQREEQREARMRLKEKQRASEETWADRFTQDPRTAAVSQSPRNQPPSSYQDNQAGRINSAPQPAVNELMDETKTHLRGQNVLVDPVTRREQEEKRRKHLEYQAAIKAQIEEKERLKREEREKKWREEAEEERKLKAERDALQRQLEVEDSKNRQKEEARQRQVEHLKNMMDAEQERAQEQRMIKRLATLQQAGHDVSGLKAHYEAITPRFQQAVVDPASIPGLQASPRDNYGTGHSPRANPSGYWTAEGPTTMRNQEASTRPLNHEPYTENRVLTPSRFRQASRPRSNPGSPQREFATQTDDLMELSNGLRKEMSEVEIEYRDRPTRNSNSKGGKNVRVKSAERKKPAENPRGRPPAPKQNRQKQQQQQQKGKPATWNYQNPQKKAPVKQSEKDPFYEQKRMESEERRAKRERQLQYLVELNKQDPILNPGLVRDHPTARQDQILQQLSSLKQSLIQRQREIETCMSPSDLEKQV